MIYRLCLNPVICVRLIKNRRAIARLILAAGRDHKRVKEIIQRFKKLAQSHTLGGLDWKKLRDEGRR